MKSNELLSLLLSTIEEEFIEEDDTSFVVEISLGLGNKYVDSTSFIFIVVEELVVDTKLILFTS